MNRLEYLLDLAASRNVPIQIVVNIEASENLTEKPKKKPRKGKSVTGLSDAGLMALAAISNGTVDASEMTVNELAIELGIPKTSLYRDAVFRRMFAEYTRTGRLPRTKGIWDERTGDFDVEDG